MAQHAVVFVDHAQAKVLYLDGSEPQVIDGEAPRRVGENLHGSQRFFAEIAGAIHETPEILVVGPGTAKTEFLHYLDTHHRDVRDRVLGIETVDHPTENQLLALANRTFKAIDQMR